MFLFPYYNQQRTKLMFKSVTIHFFGFMPNLPHLKLFTVVCLIFSTF